MEASSDYFQDREEIDESKIVRVIKKANTEATIPLEKMSEEE